MSHTALRLREALEGIRSYKYLKEGCFVIRRAQVGWLAFYTHRVAAGPASDVEELVEQSLDLNAYLGKNAESTFCIRVSGYPEIL